jgi:hypothetical protein
VVTDGLVVTCLLVLHQGRFVALCAMNLAGNMCNDDDECMAVPHLSMLSWVCLLLLLLPAPPGALTGCLQGHLTGPPQPWGMQSYAPDSTGTTQSSSVDM